MTLVTSTLARLTTTSHTWSVATNLTDIRSSRRWSSPRGRHDGCSPLWASTGRSPLPPARPRASRSTRAAVSELVRRTLLDDGAEPRFQGGGAVCHVFFCLLRCYLSSFCGAARF